MAIFAVGAYYQTDVSGAFISANIVGVGWDIAQAPDLHQLIRTWKVGDLVYIKSAAPRSPDIEVKAVGIVADDVIRTSADTNNLVQVGRNVRWLSTQAYRIPKPADEKNNVRMNTLYEEYHPVVQQLIIAGL